MLSAREELYTIRGDAADPAAAHLRDGGVIGHETQLDLTTQKTEVPIRWRDRLSVVDVYEMGDHLHIHMICPRCENCLLIDSRKKRIRFNRSERRLDIERIGCTYFGCGWSAVIEGNLARSEA